MRHHNQVRKFGRSASQRRALLNGLARSLVIREKIRTTEAKAKELRPFIEKLITHSRKGTLSSRRLVISFVGEDAGKKMIEDVGPRFKDRPGGYTRILKLPNRKSDGAKMAQIELV